jgi:hypothetical protein
MAAGRGALLEHPTLAVNVQSLRNVPESGLRDSFDGTGGRVHETMAFEEHGPSVCRLRFPLAGVDRQENIDDAEARTLARVARHSHLL